MRTPPSFADTPANVIRLSDGPDFASTVREIVALVDAAMPGSQMMLGGLMESLFAEMLRRHIARLPRESTGMHCCKLRCSIERLTSFASVKWMDFPNRQKCHNQMRCCDL